MVVELGTIIYDEGFRDVESVYYVSVYELNQILIFDFNESSIYLLKESVAIRINHIFEVLLGSRPMTSKPHNMRGHGLRMECNSSIGRYVNLECFWHVTHLLATFTSSLTIYG